MTYTLSTTITLPWAEALDRAGFAIIATGLEQCIVQKDASLDKKDLEKLFLSLA